MGITTAGSLRGTRLHIQLTLASRSMLTSATLAIPTGSMQALPRVGTEKVGVMSKKHFIALADMLRTARMGATGTPSVNPFKQEHIEFLADFCQSQNPRFNRQRWLDYIAGECGPNGGSIKKAA